MQRYGANLLAFLVYNIVASAQKSHRLLENLSMAEMWTNYIRNATPWTEAGFLSVLHIQSISERLAESGSEYVDCNRSTVLQ